MQFSELPVGKDADTPVPLMFDTQFGSNAAILEGVSPTLKASQQSPTVAFVTQEDDDRVVSVNDNEAVAVRRLTPLECERLMGWEDNWTLLTSDGREQAETHRYKQCGNGVASPVAEWIGRKIIDITEQQ